MIQFIILSFFNLSGTEIEAVIQLVSKLIVAYFYLRSFYIVFNRIKTTLIIGYCSVLFLVLVNFLVFPENILFNFLFTSLLSFFYMLSIRDFNIFYNVAEKISEIVLLLGGVLSILVVMNYIEMDQYSMSFGYYLVLPSLMLLKGFLQKFSFVKLMLFAITILMILALGSRGPLLCILIFLLLYTLFTFNKSSINSIYTQFATICGIIIIYLTKEWIFNIIGMVFFNYGINSRSITLLTRDTGIHLSGRESNYDKVWNIITENPLFGAGITSDATVLNGGYAHNVFLEIWASYGLVIGSVMFIIILTILVLTIFKSTKTDKVNLLLWFCIGFIPLLVSGTYLTTFQFWIFLGLLFNLYSQKSGYRQQTKAE